MSCQIEKSNTRIKLKRRGEAVEKTIDGFHEI